MNKKERSASTEAHHPNPRGLWSSWGGGTEWSECAGHREGIERSERGDRSNHLLSPQGGHKEPLLKEKLLLELSHMGKGQEFQLAVIPRPQVCHGRPTWGGVTDSPTRSCRFSSQSSTGEAKVSESTQLTFWSHLSWNLTSGPELRLLHGVPVRMC